MKNAYTILGVSQNANQHDIVKGQISALKAKKYSAGEISNSFTQLRTPHKRLAVDFTFPIFKSRIATTVNTDIRAEKIDIEQIEPDIFDSLKKQ